MTLRSRGLLLAVLHIAIVLSVGAKLLYDRATRPRVWVETIPIDPQLPIRGRYIRLQLVVTAPDIRRHEALPVKLKIDNDRLIAEPETDLSALSQPRVSWRSGSGGEAVAVLSPPVAFFLP
ncbi:MAG TPA: hypothetical protein VE131_16165, partial [Terriglobales bacterium]|nr:hypothetical protein [Terriglobales bacterium]